MVIPLPAQGPVHLIELLDVVLVSTYYPQLHVEVASDVKLFCTSSAPFRSLTRVNRNTLSNSKKKPTSFQLARSLNKKTEGNTLLFLFVGASVIVSISFR